MESRFCCSVFRVWSNIVLCPLGKAHIGTCNWLSGNVIYHTQVRILIGTHRTDHSRWQQDRRKRINDCTSFGYCVAQGTDCNMTILFKHSLIFYVLIFCWMRILLKYKIQILWAGHVVRMVEMSNEYRFWRGNLKGRESLWDLSLVGRRISELNSEECACHMKKLDWTQTAQCRVQWRAFFGSSDEPYGFIRARNFLTSRIVTNFDMGTQYYKVG
jgi:hypothetical protein